LPIPGDHLQPEAILQTPAVQLFVARASAVRPDFTLNSANASAIAEICLLLDGLPLAIELASSLLRLFAPHNLLNHLKSNPGLAGRSAAMHLLAGGARDLPARQQTLRAAIDWSYNLLAPAEQRVFRWMSIFSGGCTLEAAEAICMDETDAPVSILDALIPLIEKNLLRSDQRSGEPWFGMLRTIQEYAREKLEASGELLIANERLVQYFLDWAERSEPELKGPDQALWLKRLELDHDNLRAGLAWSIEYGEIEVAYRLGGALWRFWTNRGYLFEGRQWLERILSMDG
jgi:predicted ATPase